MRGTMRLRLLRHIAGRPSPILAAEQGGDLVSDATSAFPDHLGIAEGLPGSDHGLALSRRQDKQGGMAFCHGAPSNWVRWSGN